MKTLFHALLAAMLAFPFMAQAQSRSDYVITVERKKTGGGNLKSTERVSRVGTSQNWTGSINIQNRTFKPSPALEVRYMLFVKRQRLGEETTQEQVDKVKGNAKVDSIKGGAKATVLTEEVTLNKAQMAAGWIAVGNGNSSRQSAQDSVHGVWVRLYDPEGNMVGEYVNPTTITQKYEWQE